MAPPLRTGSPLRPRSPDLRERASSSPGGRITAIGSALPWYSWFKAAVFALLAGNTAFYLFAGTLNKALDAAAWLALLALFELETGFGERLRGKGAAVAIRGARLAAAAMVGATAIGYLYGNEWLDAVNSWLWIAVVVLLEIEVRYPRAVARCRSWFAAAAVTLYSGLGALVLVWAWRREWLDAYDALLWLAAFAMIEMNVLRVSRKGVAA